MRCPYCQTEFDAPGEVGFETTREMRREGDPPQKAAAWLLVDGRPVWADGPLHWCERGVPRS